MKSLLLSNLCIMVAFDRFTLVSHTRTMTSEPCWVTGFHLYNNFLNFTLLHFLELFFEKLCVLPQLLKY